ncbi:class II aldolase/adducin family protein [Cognatishimia sp. D5M38]|uniref:Class II aldolase/adducin family protein n=3 Tax=Alphaproteobacteria TaxID=28211 RepID=A0ABU8QKU2_9RHOB|nr:class II aldolase/adducin family protein [Rhodovulum sp.]
MTQISDIIDDLVVASHILASEGVCDAFGHVSARHPDNPSHFVMARARAPELVEHDDMMVFTHDGAPVGGDDRKPFLERFIHGSLYAARPDVQSVVHSHSRSVIPFSVTPGSMRPIVHSCGVLGKDIPVWDAQDSFGDTNLLISSQEMGHDFAGVVAEGRCALMRGHGSTVIGSSIREAVYSAVYLEVNAQLQITAQSLGPVKFLTDGEIDLIQSRLADGKPGEGYDRAWEYWARRTD